MDIAQFQERVCSLLVDGACIDDDLTLRVHSDGTLGAKINGESLPTEGAANWDDALDIIVRYLTVYKALRATEAETLARFVRE